MFPTVVPMFITRTTLRNLRSGCGWCQTQLPLVVSPQAARRQRSTLRSPVPASEWTARRLQSAVANTCAQDTTGSVPAKLLSFVRTRVGKTHTTDSSEKDEWWNKTRDKEEVIRPRRVYVRVHRKVGKKEMRSRQESVEISRSVWETASWIIQSPSSRHADLAPRRKTQTAAPTHMSGLLSRASLCCALRVARSREKR